MEEWKHIATIIDGEKFQINRINIWDFKWENTYIVIKVKDSYYNQIFSFHVYKIKVEEIEIEFVAGEFSNCVWGIYLKDKI